VVRWFDPGGAGAGERGCRFAAAMENANESKNTSDPSPVWLATPLFAFGGNGLAKSAGGGS